MTSCLSLLKTALKVPFIGSTKDLRVWGETVKRVVATACCNCSAPSSSYFMSFTNGLMWMSGLSLPIGSLPSSTDEGEVVSHLVDVLLGDEGMLRLVSMIVGLTEVGML